MLKSFYNKLNVKIMKFPESKCKSLFLMQNIEINFTFSFDSTMGCILKKIENAKLQKCT